MEMCRGVVHVELSNRVALCRVDLFMFRRTREPQSRNYFFEKRLAHSCVQGIILPLALENMFYVLRSSFNLLEKR
jgi:hypothetical protein